MATQASACGIYDCAKCDYLAKGLCHGCSAGNMRLQNSGESICAVFECVSGKAISHCSQCRETSCTLKRSVESLCPMRSRFENTRWWAGRMARAFEARKGTAGLGKKREISEKVINRLRWYLTALDEFAQQGATSISSWRLAERVGINAALIRKDLSRFGEFGTPSLGYDVDFLIHRIRDILCLNRSNAVLWVGAASLRLHLASISRLSNHTCRVVAIFDSNADEAGQMIGDVEVQHLDKLENKVAESSIQAATLAITGRQAVDIAERLAGCGITAILNLSGEMLNLPDSVRVTSFDLVGELLELCYYSGS